MGPTRVSGPVTHPGTDHAGSRLQQIQGVHRAAPPKLRTRTGPYWLQPAAGQAASPPLGLDVSAYQPSIDWATVKAEGARFAYVKATEGTGYVNPYFASQYNGSYNVGLIRGAYHFALPDRSSGTAQADYFVSNGGGWSADGRTLPGALDIEYNPYGAECYGLSASAMVSWIARFAGEYRSRASRWPVIYSTFDWWNTCTRNYGGFASNDPLWIACFCSTAGTLPARWPTYTFWQYADSGIFPGDQDLFNGDSAGLSRLATGGLFAATPAALTDHSGTVRVYARFPDGSLRQDWLPRGGTWKGFGNLGGEWPDNPAAFVDSGGIVRVYEVGTTGDLYEKHLPSGGTWSGWVHLGGPSGKLTGVPAAVEDGSGTIRVYVRGTGGSLNEVHLPSGGSWSGWYNMGGSWHSNPAAVADSSGVVRVYAVGTTTNMYEKHLNPGGIWSGWIDLSGALQGVPSVTRDRAGTVRVYAVGTNGAMYEDHLPSRGAWSGWTNNMGGTWPSTDPSALTGSGGTVRVYAIRTNHNLYEDRLATGGRWSGWADLHGSLQGVPSATEDQGGRVRVYGRGTTGYLFEISLPPVGSWSAPYRMGGPVA